MNENKVTPFIPASQSLAEITIKAVVLAVIITAILAAANAYLALKLGQTISASIPAAVISMAALRMFKKHNILENNIVQTAASGGEGVASGVCFVLPALVMTGYWKYFHYWETTLMILVGGFLGVLFSIPLRRVMLNYPTLRFPEGTAIAHVLKASAAGTAKMHDLLKGSLIGATIGVFQTGFKIASDSLSLWTASGKVLFGFTLGFSPALLGAGFIIGMQACVAMLVGLALGWCIGMPVYTAIYGLPHGITNYFDMAMAMRADHIRYIGVGTMLLGGLWTLVTLLKPIVVSIRTSLISLKETKKGNLSGMGIPRTEHDISISYVIVGVVVLALIAYASFFYFFDFEHLQISQVLHHGLSLFAAVFVLLIGFLMAAVCAYLSGLVGMTNNPLSGLMLGCVLLSSLILLPILGHAVRHDPEALKAAVTMVLIITTIIAVIVAISGENMQDLKAGQLVGATPWKQQVMLMIGVVVAALVVAPTLELLFQAYGIGGVYPRPGMNPAQMLSAPQAGLMEAVAHGTFGGSLQMTDICVGLIIGVVAIFIDEHLKKSGRRLPILAIGIGIYLPPDITSAVILGGALNYLCKRVILSRNKSQDAEHQAKALEQAFEAPIISCCGLVAGAALVGVLLAIPFVLKGNTDALSLVSAGFEPIAEMIGLVVLVLLCVWIYRTACKKRPVVG
jgi:putative OPT family oligopeptide transporter